MKGALYLIGLAVVAILAIRFLIRMSTDRTMLNGSSPFKFLAHDSTVGAYDRQGRDFAREMDEEIEGLPTLQQERAADEARTTHPETRTGG